MREGLDAGDRAVQIVGAEHRAEQIRRLPRPASTRWPPSNGASSWCRLGRTLFCAAAGSTNMP
jgi:hypothetical protein